MSEEIITSGVNQTDTLGSLIDPVAMGEQVLSSARTAQTEEAQVLNFLREQLKRGARIFATDTEKDVLIPRGDGTWQSGLTFQYPEGSDAAAAIAELNDK